MNSTHMCLCGIALCLLIVGMSTVVLQHILKCSCEVCYRLLMLCKMGTMVEYSVFGQETTVDWTIISDAKGKS